MLTLSDVEPGVTDAAAGLTDVAALVATFRALGYVVDLTRLHDAIDLAGALAGLQDGSRDPYHYLDAQPTATVNVRDHAIVRCENDLFDCLTALLRDLRPLAAVSP